jgi:hypothetical protein
VHPTGHTVATGALGKAPKIVLWDAQSGATLKASTANVMLCAMPCLSGVCSISHVPNVLCMCMRCFVRSGAYSLMCAVSTCTQCAPYAL